jgi:hypothetical protein
MGAVNVNARRFAGRLALLGLFALPLGCPNPFKPADPEPPKAGGVFEDYSEPEKVLETMVLAVNSKSSGGTDAWLHAFADSQLVGERAFRAFYDPAVKQNWQIITTLAAPEPWDLVLERNLPVKLFGIRTLADYTFEWAQDTDSPNDEDPNKADTVMFHRHYKLTATQGSNKETICIGFADLSFQKNKDGVTWSIFHWNDRLDQTIGVNPPATDERTMSWWRLESLARH